MNAPPPAYKASPEEELAWHAECWRRSGLDVRLAKLTEVNQKFETPLPADVVEALARGDDKPTQADRDAVPQTSEPGNMNVFDLVFRGSALRRQGRTYIQIRDELTALNEQREEPSATSLINMLAERAMGKKAFPNTESGDAEFFAALHERDVRYDHKQARWLLHDVGSGIWLPDQVERLHGLALEMMRERQLSAVRTVLDPEEKKKAARWAIAGESARRLDSTLRLARTMPPISDSGNDWDQQPYLLGTPNGVVDLRTGVLRKGAPNDRVTMRVAVPFDPDASCLLWEQTVWSIFGGDETLIDFVHRAFGYSMTGDCREESLFFMYGSGGNGKGTLINTVAHVLGEYQDNVLFATLERHERASIPADVAKLVGKRLVTASESGGGRELNVERIKALTGRDPMTARFMHRNYFTFEPVAKFWLSSNEKPVVRDDSEGFWRRVHLIPFEQSFVAHPDVRLKDKLKAEGPGILAWLVRGALAWQREGLNPPDKVCVATQEYRAESEPLADFIEERCVVAESVHVMASELFTAYARWADGYGIRPSERFSQKTFGLQVKKRFETKRTSAGMRYFGIGLREMTYEPSGEAETRF